MLWIFAQRPPARGLALLSMLCVWWAPLQGEAASTICIEFRATPPSAQRATYQWFVHILKQRGFVLQGQDRASCLRLALEWTRQGVLKARQKKLRQSHRFGKGDDPWSEARAGVNFLDFFLDYVILHSRKKERKEWQKARATLRSSPQVKPSRLPKRGAVEPRTRRVASRRPAKAPSRRVPKRAPAATGKSKPPRPRPKLRQRTRPPARRRKAAKLARAPQVQRPLASKAQRPSGLQLLVDLGLLLAAPGYDGLSFGLGSHLEMALWGWRIGLSSRLRWAPPAEAQRSTLLLKPALLFGPPYLQLGAAVELSLNLGLASEFFHLSLGSQSSWLQRWGGLLELLALIRLGKDLSLSARAILELNPQVLSQSHAGLTTTLAPWTLSLRLGLHWRIF